MVSVLISGEDEHHRWLISQSVEHAVLLDRQREELEARIKEKLEPWREQNELLQTVPGVKEMTAATILAEAGSDMSPFQSAKHLCSWAGICPGNNRSAGKSKHSRIKKGNKFLLAALVQAGWAAARKRDSIFQRKFHRWMRRLGEAKANIALAHSLLELIYAIWKTGRPYQEPDPDALHAGEKEKLIRHHARRLRKLGADEALIEEMVNRLNKPPACSPVQAQALTAQPLMLRRASPAKVCRGALGFRARQTRIQQYSVLKELEPGPPRRSRPRPKAKNKTNTLNTE
jgi:hypothetical protein